MIPPWQKFPTYTAWTMGWRMGHGEDYLWEWHEFIQTLPVDFTARLTYLESHRPAPYSWADTVRHLLSQGDAERFTHGDLVELGLLEADAAFRTWSLQQTGISWPGSWTRSDLETALNHQTRDFWFFCRQLQRARQRGAVEIPADADLWTRLERPLRTGDTGPLDLNAGLESLAKILITGDMHHPWQLGLDIDDHKGSIQNDMGFVDAYYRWIIFCFDDDILLNQIVGAASPPPIWQDWIREHSVFDRPPT